MSEIVNNENPELWVDQYGDVLYSYALSRLNNVSSAEDVVQETFLAAFRSKEKFTGEASLQTWLISILKHKIVDLIRKESRETVAEETDAIEEPADQFFDRKGHWRVAPADWKIHPGKVLEQKEFMNVLSGCLGHLPDKLRRLFVLRELEELETEEICGKLGISSSNLWVMLYRARMKLRGCLSENWSGVKSDA